MSKDENADEDDVDARTEIFRNLPEGMTRTAVIEDRFTGIGILQFSSPDFMTDLEKCQDELSKLRKKFRQHMLVLTKGLGGLASKASGKIILSYLVEILQRLDYNSYYAKQVEAIQEQNAGSLRQ